MLISLILALLMAALMFVIVRGTNGILGAVATFITVYFIVYMGMPVLNYGFYGLPFLLLIVSVAACLLSLIEDNKNKMGLLAGVAATFVSISWLVVIPFVTTWGGWMGHDADYRALITIEEQDADGNVFKFDEDVQLIDPKTVRLVDQNLATKLAETKLNAEGTLGSRFKLGTFNISSVNGKKYWVAPLVWIDPIKFLAGDRGTAGFMMVNENNPRDIRLMTTDKKNNPLSLRYLAEGGYFWTHLPRHLWNNGYQSTGVTDYTFELDDNLNPFYVATKYDLKVGFDGVVATGVIVVDPQTGDFEEFDIADAPAWIDRIQPEGVVLDRLTDWGDYVHGYWNFEGRDILKPTPGLALVEGTDGNFLWFTGMQTENADSGIAGFVLVDTRNGKGRFYRIEGVTETACQTNMLQAFAEKPGWGVSKCIMYNVNGFPTYIAIITDADGNLKYISVASVQYRDVVVHDNTLEGALRKYRIRIRNQGLASTGDGEKNHEVIEGTISNIGSNVMDGNSTFYFTLLEKPGMVYMVRGANPEVPVTVRGSSVRITADAVGDGTADVIDFDNLNVGVTKIPAEVELDSEEKETRD